MQIDDVDQPNTTDEQPWRIDPILGIGLTIPALILIAFGYYLYQKRANRILHETVRATRAEADVLAKSDPDKAAARYQDVITLIGSRASGSPELRIIREAVIAGRDRAAAVIKKRQDDEALAKRIADEQAKAVAAEKAERDRMEGLKVEISGDAWVNKAGGQSEIIRGLVVYLLPAQSRSGSVRSVLSRIGEEFGERVKQIEYAASLPGAHPNAIAISEKQAAQAKRVQELAANIATQESIDMKVAWTAVRLGALYDNENNQGRQIEQIEGDRYWPEVIQDVAVQTVNGDVNGRYSVKGIKGGKYYLYAQYHTAFSLMEWLVPVEITKDGPIKLDFCNETSIKILNKN